MEQNKNQSAEPLKSKKALSTSNILGTISCFCSLCVLAFEAGIATGIISLCLHPDKKAKRKGIIGISLNAVGAFAFLIGCFVVLSNVNVPPYSENLESTFFRPYDYDENANNNVDLDGFVNALSSTKHDNLTVYSRIQNPQKWSEDDSFRMARFDGTKVSYSESEDGETPFTRVAFGLLKNERIYRYRLLEDGSYNTRVDPTLSGWAYPYQSIRSGVFEIPGHSEADLPEIFQKLVYDGKTRTYSFEEPLTKGHYYDEKGTSSVSCTFLFENGLLKDLRILYGRVKDSARAYWRNEFLYSDYGSVALSVPSSFPVQE